MSEPIGPVNEQYETVSGAGNNNNNDIYNNNNNINKDLYLLIWLNTKDIQRLLYDRYYYYYYYYYYYNMLQKVLPRNANDYYASGSNDMITLRENRFLLQ